MDFAIGETIHTLSIYAEFGLAAAGFGVLYKLGGIYQPAYDWLISHQAEKHMLRAIDLTLNSIEGVSRNAVIPIAFTNIVLGAAVEYFLKNAPYYVRAALGDPRKIALKIFALMDVDKKATLPDLDEVFAKYGIDPTA